jgi:hypothetical protein
MFTGCAHSPPADNWYRIVQANLRETLSKIHLDHLEEQLKEQLGVL